MSKKKNQIKKKTALKQTETTPTPQSGLKRMVVTMVRWSAWITLLSVLLTQLTGNMLEDRLALGMFVIAGLLYAISMVLERKYKW